MTFNDSPSGLLQLPSAQAGVRIRLWRQEDVPAYRNWLQPEQDWHRWDAPYFPPLEPEQIDAVLAQVELALRHDQGWMWPRSSGKADRSAPVTRAVIADEETDELLGTVSWYWESEITLWARMGIQIFDPGKRGAGRGATALKLWTDYLFGATAWQRLDYATWSGNTAMLRVGEKLGFSQEARFRNARVVDGKFYDSVVMGVLRSEWERGVSN